MSVRGMPVGKTLFNLLRNRHVFVLGLTLILLFGARELRLSDPPFIASLRWITFDTYQRFKPRRLWVNQSGSSTSTRCR